MDINNLEFEHDIFVKVDIDDILKKKKRSISKDSKYITMPVYDDGIKHKINIIRTYMNKDGNDVGGRPYFECPTCNSKKRHLFYPYQYIPVEDRIWQCFKCTQNDPSIGYVVYNNKELAKYIVYKNNGEEAAKPYITLFPIQKQYGSTQVNSDSYKRVVDRIAMLFRSKDHKLNPDIEEVLRNKVVADRERTRKNVSDSLSDSFASDIEEELRKVGGKRKDIEILDNLLLYRKAIIDKKIRYYSAIADMAMHERTYSYFPALLQHYYEHYIAVVKLLSKEKREELGIKIPEYFKKLCERHKYINFTGWTDIKSALTIKDTIINRQTNKEEESKLDIPSVRIDPIDL